METMMIATNNVNAIRFPVSRSRPEWGARIEMSRKAIANPVKLWYDKFEFDGKGVGEWGGHYGKAGNVDTVVTLMIRFKASAAIADRRCRKGRA